MALQYVNMLIPYVNMVRTMQL